MPIPSLRLRSANDASIRDDGEYVLYWMIAQRRTRWNFALDHAVDRARELGKPLVVLEALRCGYRHASDRLHRFVIEGMVDNARRLADAGIAHHAYLEERAGDGEGLLAALASRACLAVTDEYPCFFLPPMVAAAGLELGRKGIRLEVVDGNGLLPLRAAEGKVFGRAVDFRRFLQKNLARHLGDLPRPDPLAEVGLPRLETVLAECARRWPNRAASLASGDVPDLSAFAIDHDVAPVERIAGGADAGRAVLDDFLDQAFARYGEDGRNLDQRADSGLSPYLHFGHVGSHQIFATLCAHLEWDPSRLPGPNGPTPRGARSGWWDMPSHAESFLDQLVTWRELGFNFCFHRDDYDRFDSLPDWARATLAQHAGDPRPDVYDRETLERAATHDEIWNAAQRELLRDGRIHNYLRMLWGKKIFEWSPSPRDAVEIMVELNDRYALDGRDPNSYSGIFWCLGRYDRAWGPEREIFGKIRYMSSDQARRKLQMTDYLERFGDGGTVQQPLF